MLLLQAHSPIHLQNYYKITVRAQILPALENSANFYEDYIYYKEGYNNMHGFHINSLFSV